MMVLDFAQEDMRFQVRVAAVCIHDGHVLLQGSRHHDRWILPGGRGELLEPADEAVRREMREEFGVEVELGRLLWIVENFFTYEETRTHQLGFVFETHLPPDSDLLDTTHEFSGYDSGVPFIARWFPLATLPDIWLLPSFLCHALQSLPETTQHIVHTDGQR